MIKERTSRKISKKPINEETLNVGRLDRDRETPPRSECTKRNSMDGRRVSHEDTERACRADDYCTLNT